MQLSARSAASADGLVPGKEERNPDGRGLGRIRFFGPGRGKFPPVVSHRRASAACAKYQAGQGRRFTFDLPLIAYGHAACTLGK